MRLKRLLKVSRKNEARRLLTLRRLSSALPILTGGNALSSKLILLNLEGELPFLLASNPATGRPDLIDIFRSIGQAS